MKKSHAIGALLFALVGAVAGPCHAAFVNEGGAGELRIIGKLSQEEKALGMGRNVTIREAIRQVVPSDYSMRLGPGTDSLVDKPVSWKGGRPWTEVLAELISHIPDLSVEVDIPATLVTLSVSQVSHSIQEVGKESLPTWRIRNGDKLSDALTAWGKEAGWQAVFWEAPPMVSEIDVTFEGSFKDAVTKAIEAISKHGTKLNVEFYGANKAVRIMENK